jgi:hypothetical protein
MKDRLTVITASDYVIKPAFDLDPRLSWHFARIVPSNLVYYAHLCISKDGVVVKAELRLFALANEFA